MTDKPVWVIQTNKLPTRQYAPLFDAVKALGYPYVDIAVDEMLGGILTDVPDTLNLIPHGSTTLMKLAEERKWRQLYTNDNFYTDVWNANRDDMLNSDGVVMTLSEAKKLPSGQYFIRPKADLKAFAGELIHTEKLIPWVENLEKGDCEFDGSLLISVAEPKELMMEWRFFVVNRKVITGSSYRYLGRPHQKSDMDITEAFDAVQGWLPHDCCCMDMALTPDGVKIVEFNGLNASGFYDHDVKALAKAVYEYAEEHS